MVITTSIHHISPDYQQRQGSGRRRNNISRMCGAGGRDVGFISATYCPLTNSVMP
jgi:hypothetical protein